MRNQYMAKVLVHNKVVTEAQVKAHWGEITDKKDIGQVLVDAGILPPPMYIKPQRRRNPLPRALRLRRHRRLQWLLLRSPHSLKACRSKATAACTVKSRRRM